MKVVKRSEAMKKQSNTTRITKYCGGKYQWHGTQSTYIGRDIKLPEGSNVLALFVERRADAHGPYACLMCIVED